MVRSKKTKEKKLGNISKRVLAALFMLPIVIGTLWFGYPYIDILALFVGVLLSWEWSNMTASDKKDMYATWAGSLLGAGLCCLLL